MHNNPNAMYNSGLILGLHPGNESRRYKVTPSLIDWAQTKNQPAIESAVDRLDTALQRGIIGHTILTNALVCKDGIDGL